MRQITKSMRLNNVRYDVRGPVAEEAERMAAEGIEIIHLNTGNPAQFDLTAPDYILNQFEFYARDAQAYSQSKGVLQAREAIANHYIRKGISGVSASDIYTGNGVSELITLSMQALLNDGDEVLIPMPDYPLWTAAVHMAGGVAAHYICDEAANWYPDILDIERKVSSKTKAIVIINPNNPTGAVYPEEHLQRILDIAREHDLIVFSDEIYECLIMDGKQHISTASLAPDLLVVTMSGLSKSHRLAGFRIGWMCLSGEKSYAGDYIHGLNTLSSMRLCSNVPSQMIIEAALNNYHDADSLIIPGGRLYEQRETIVKAINAIPGLSVVKPEAAFYIFPKIDTKRFRIYDDQKFILDFLRQHHVLMVHGRGFQWQKPDHFRMVFLPEIETLTCVANRLEEFLSSYQQTK